MSYLLVEPVNAVLLNLSKGKISIRALHIFNRQLAILCAVSGKNNVSCVGCSFNKNVIILYKKRSIHSFNHAPLDETR